MTDQKKPESADWPATTAKRKKAAPGVCALDFETAIRGGGGVIYGGKNLTTGEDDDE